MDIVLTANSPGEVAVWLTPAVRSLRAKAPQATITVCIPPCTFASGTESAVVRRLPEVDRVVPPRQLLAFILLGRRPPGWRPAQTGVVCFLGGDMLYAALLAGKLRYPAVAYTEGRARWEQVYRKFLVPDERAGQRARKAGAVPEHVEVIGDLMLDAVHPCAASKEEARRLLQLPADGLVLALFPGSRAFELRAMMPFFARVAEIVVKAVDKPVQVVASLSPFAAVEALAAAAAAVPAGYEGATGTIEPLAFPGVNDSVGLWRLRTAQVTIQVLQGLQYDVMLASDLAITGPGSNTVEMAYLGLPMVVATPLNRPEDIPLEGLPGVVGKLPLVGPALKRAAVRRLAGRVRFTALPNRKAGRMLVPEVRGHLQPADIAIPVVDLLQSGERRQALGRRLQELMGEPGAADKLAEAILTAAAGR